MKDARNNTAGILVYKVLKPLLLGSFLFRV